MGTDHSKERETERAKEARTGIAKEVKTEIRKELEREVKMEDIVGTVPTAPALRSRRRDGRKRRRSLR